MTDLGGLLGALGLRGEQEYEPHCHLSQEFLKEFQEIEKESHVLENKSRELAARKQLFWAKIEQSLGIFDKDLRIDTDAGMVLIEKKKETVKEDESSKNNDKCAGEPNAAA